MNMPAARFMPPTHQPLRLVQPKSAWQQHAKAECYARRLKAAEALDQAGHHLKAIQLRECGSHDHVTRVAVCSRNPEHYSRALPHTCKLAFCPDCNLRQSLETARIYVPIVRRARSKARDCSLALLTLTTPHHIFDEDIKQRIKPLWASVIKTFETACRTVLANELSAEEKRRAIVTLKAHQLGFIGNFEFGAQGHELHFHLLTLAPYIDQLLWRDVWAEKTDGLAQVVHVTTIPPTKADIQATLRYVSKGPCADPAVASRLAEILPGTRRQRTGGVFYGEASKAPKYHCTCPSCGGRTDAVPAGMLPMYNQHTWAGSRKAMSRIGYGHRSA